MSKKIDEYIDIHELGESINHNETTFRYELLYKGKVVSWIDDNVPDEDIIYWLEN